MKKQALLLSKLGGKEREEALPLGKPSGEERRVRREAVICSDHCYGVVTDLPHVIDAATRVHTVGAEYRDFGAPMQPLRFTQKSGTNRRVSLYFEPNEAR